MKFAGFFIGAISATVALGAVVPSVPDSLRAPAFMAESDGPSFAAPLAKHKYQQPLVSPPAANVPFSSTAARQFFDPPGNLQKIVCHINGARALRRLQPIFLHQSLTEVAQHMGERFANGTLGASDFEHYVRKNISPLGPNVWSGYKILGIIGSDDEYAIDLEQSINVTLFAPALDAIGIFMENGTYVAVLASGLRDRPDKVESCPEDSSQFTANKGVFVKPPKDL